jgi:Na+/melibiose symporter-like transporter
MKLNFNLEDLIEPTPDIANTNENITRDLYQLDDEQFQPILNKIRSRRSTLHSIYSASGSTPLPEPDTTNQDEQELETKNDDKDDILSNLSVSLMRSMDLETEEKHKLSKLRRNFALFILIAFNLLSYIDRYIIGAVLIDIRTFFDISATVAGALESIFLISFLLVAPFVGYIGDKYPKYRKSMLIFCCILWLISIVGGSFCTKDQFGLFFFSRILFGFASAFYECIALPIISDLFEVIKED